MVKGFLDEELMVVPPDIKLIEPFYEGWLNENQSHDQCENEYDFHQGPFFFMNSGTLYGVYTVMDSKNGFSTAVEQAHFQDISRNVYWRGISNSKVKRKSGKWKCLLKTLTAFDVHLRLKKISCWAIVSNV